MWNLNLTLLIGNTKVSHRKMRAKTLEGINEAVKLWLDFEKKHPYELIDCNGKRLPIGAKILTMTIKYTAE